MLKDLQLPFDWHHELKQLCDDLEIEFLSTPFDATSLAFLTDQLNLETIKLGSGELTNGPLLFNAARSGRKLIVSTGMSNGSEVAQAIGLIGSALDPNFEFTSNATPALFEELSGTNQVIDSMKNKVSLMHCTSEYPADYNGINLNAIETMRNKYGLPVGYSDHTMGIHISTAAVALGASLIEKHFTLDRDLPGPDHVASIEPEELESMVRQIRDVEVSLGDGVKSATSKEIKNKLVVRKVLLANENIRRGERFTPQNIVAKRSGPGRSPMDYWFLLGRPSTRSYKKGEVIE
jgi:N-acetylneuraminate synthase